AIDHKLPALALLPADFAAGNAELTPFESWLDQQFGMREQVSVPVCELMAKWSPGSTATVSKRDAELLSRLLERCGYGVEPDIRFGGMNLSKSASATLFRLPSNAPSEPSDAYKAATALARLGILVALADDKLTTDEQHFLDRHVTNALLLSGAEQIRLRAHLHWTISSPADLSGLKECCAALDDGQRQRFGQFLIGVAGADGRITPNELKSLAKTYRLLGLDPETVAHDVHSLATSSNVLATAPVTIIPADNVVPSFTIPSERSEAPPATIELSAEKVSAILSETHIVTSILEQVFVEDEPESASEDDEIESGAEMLDRIPGLDEPHTTLVRHLMKRPMWARYEVDELSERLGLLTAGAIETINEVSFSVTDEPFAEGDDPIEINAQVFVNFALA
ncbi:MAG TPA: tellurite resistance TerB C-terminal domain-containing protein, partial [Nitrolancea sp.]